MAHATVPGLLLVLLAILAAGGVWFFHSRRRLLLDTPTSPAGALPQGRVEVKGTAAPAPGVPPLQAPFSGAPCVHWSYAIEEQRTRRVHRTVNGKSTPYTERYWVTVASGHSPHLFAVRDATGLALVDPRGADVPDTRRQAYRSGTFRDPPPAVLRVLQAQGIPYEGFFGLNKTMRYTERSLPEGTPLFVLGHAGPGPDGGLAIKRGPDTPFIISARSEESLLLGYAVGLGASALAALAAGAGGLFLLLS